MITHIQKEWDENHPPSSKECHNTPYDASLPPLIVTFTLILAVGKPIKESIHIQAEANSHKKKKITKEKSQIYCDLALHT